MMDESAEDGINWEFSHGVLGTHVLCDRPHCIRHIWDGYVGGKQHDVSCIDKFEVRRRLQLV